jgi:BolA protein
MTIASTHHEIRRRLSIALAPSSLTIANESQAHKGHHKGDDMGPREHFKVHICSSQFNHRSRIEQHRMVYEALEKLMHTHIHALALVTAPSEASQ